MRSIIGVNLFILLPPLCTGAAPSEERILQKKRPIREAAATRMRAAL